MSDPQSPNSETRTARINPNKAKPRRRLALGDNTPARTKTTDTPTRTKPKPSAKPPATDTRYQKRQPLTKKEHAFLSDLYYKKSGYAGRDVLYNQLKTYYDKEGTPKKDRISRRRMWEFFLDRQEVNQLHRAQNKSSLLIRPISNMHKLDRVQADLIIRGGDSVRKYKGILCVIDVATRKAWTRVLTNTKSGPVAKEMDSILGQIRSEMSDADKKRKDKAGKSKTVSVLMSDNGAEFKGEFTAFLKSKNIRHVLGVANKSTSQSLIERFNRTLFMGISKEQTATGKPWHELVEAHTAHYNNKTNRNLRVKKDPKDAKSQYKIYTPNELWEETDPSVLARLHNEKLTSLSKSNKAPSVREAEIEVGTSVRLADFGKRKAALTKGFTQNWSKEIHTVYKIKRPKDPASGRPVKFFVKDSAGSIVKDNNGWPTPYTVNDLQIVRNGAEAPPEDIRPQEEDQEEPAAPATPRTPKEKAPPKPKKKHKYIGLIIRASEEEDDDTGEVTEVFKRGKKMYVKVKWTEPWKEDKNGNPVYIQNKPITEINAYVKEIEESGGALEYATE